MSDAEVSHAIRRLLPVGLIFGSILLGLGTGHFAPIPAAGIGTFLILSHGLVLRSLPHDVGLTLRQLTSALLATANTASIVYVILFSADILKGFFARTNLPTALRDWAAASALDPCLIRVVILTPGQTLFLNRVL